MGRRVDDKPSRALSRRNGSRSADKTGGRPSQLTPQVQQIIVDHLRVGAYQQTAAAAVGVPSETISEWKRWGRRDIADGKPDTIYARLWQAVCQAEAEAEFRALLNIRKAGQEDWKAEAWFMERRYPERWGMRASFTVESAALEGPVDAEFVMSGKAAEVVDAVFDAYEEQVKRVLPPAEHEGPFPP